jgi:hypothetical protein
MIRRYQNEIMIGAAVLILLGGFLYQRGMMRKLEASQVRTRQAAQEIQETVVLQKVWSAKGIQSKLQAFGRSVPGAKVQTFNLQKQKLTAVFNGLSGQELNALATRMASMPVRIESFVVDRSGDQYAMRCVCSW